MGVYPAADRAIMTSNIESVNPKNALPVIFFIIIRENS
jgi:hypothetical protein